MALSINRTLRLPDTEYFHSSDTKSGIAIHHTVGGSARSTFKWWTMDEQMVGTPYIIGRDGTIYEVYDPKCWAWQFGLKWPHKKKLKFEKRFIGIEIASEGGLIESDGKLYCFNRVSERTLKNRDEAFDYGKDYRGYRYFDKYEPAQVDSLIDLINNLCDEFNIERKAPKDYLEYYGEQLADFEGIIGHVMVRTDKSDPAPDNAFWQRIIAECGIELVDLSAPTPDEGNELTPTQITQLYQENLIEFTKMNRAAGNMVKGLLWELQDAGRNTCIRLRDAEEAGHVVFYDVVLGNPGLVKKAAKALGFKSWDSNRLEVYSA